MTMEACRMKSGVEQLKMAISDDVDKYDY